MCLFYSLGLCNRPIKLQFILDAAAANSVSRLRSKLASAGKGLASPSVHAPDRVVRDGTIGQSSINQIDGFSRVLHNRWNRDIPSVATVRQGEAVQFLCRDGGDIGSAAKTLTSNGVLTLDLDRVHPLTGPVEIEGAEPGDVLEEEILDVAPLVDFGYTFIHPALGVFGGRQPDVLAPSSQLTEASQLSDSSEGIVLGAVPQDQPLNSGAAFLQIFEFGVGQRTGFASFVGRDTGKRAAIPIAPFMGVAGVAPLRKGMYRTVPPNVSGGMGGNADIKQFVKGAIIQYPVFVEGAKFSIGDGHMAQGDGEVCVTAIETSMAVTCSFKVIKDLMIEAPRAIVPMADPTQTTLTSEMLRKGFFHTFGVGHDLMDSTKKAVRNMIDWLVQVEGISIREAYVLCSVAGDLKISEVVGAPNWVVSMILPRGIFV